MKNKFKFIASDDYDLYDDEYVLKTNDNISIQIADYVPLYCVHVQNPHYKDESDEFYLHEVQCNDLKTAMKTALEFENRR